MNATSSTPQRSEADENVALKRALALAHLQIEDLKGQLRLALIKKYGPGSEKLSDAQLNLLELEPGVSHVEVQAESVRKPLPAATNRKPRPHPGRQELLMRRELLGGSYIQADETTVDGQMHEGRGQNHQAYLWQYGRPGSGVVFDFRLGRGRDEPKKFLEQFEGILQTDAYGAYDHVGGPRIVHAACWAHARRKFFEAAQLNPRDAAATRIVGLSDELFGIDAQAREQNLDHAARHALRLELAPPWVGIIREEVEAARHASLPSSALGKAANYTLSLWRKLTRFLEYPELELSNNLAENSMRPVALGRKNWIQRREPTGRAESGGHPIHCGKLPPDEDSDPGISGRRPTRLGRQVCPATRRTCTRSLGGRGPIAPAAATVNPVVPLTHTFRILGARRDDRRAFLR